MNFSASLKGALRSLTVWTAAGIIAIGEILPYIPQLVDALGLNAATATKVTRVTGVLMLICRVLTTKTLADKAPTADIPPAVPNQKGFALMTRSTPYFLPALLALAAAAVLCLPGCSLITKLESPAALPFDQVAVAAGVDAIVMQGAPAVQEARAASIKAIATQILAADNGTTATLATLESVAQAKITSLQLPPGDAAAAALLLATLDTAINAYSSKLATNATAANVKTAVATVLGWVINECNRYIPATAAVAPETSPGVLANVAANFPVGVRSNLAVWYRTESLGD